MLSPADQNRGKNSDDSNSPAPVHRTKIYEQFKKISEQQSDNSKKTQIQISQINESSQSSHPNQKLPTIEDVEESKSKNPNTPFTDNTQKETLLNEQIITHQEPKPNAVNKIKGEKKQKPRYKFSQEKQYKETQQQTNTEIVYPNSQNQSIKSQVSFNIRKCIISVGNKDQKEQTSINLPLNESENEEILKTQNQKTLDLNYQNAKKKMLNQLCGKSKFQDQVDHEIIESLFDKLNQQKNSKTGKNSGIDFPMIKEKRYSQIEKVQYDKSDLKIENQNNKNYQIQEKKQALLQKQNHFMKISENIDSQLYNQIKNRNISFKAKQLNQTIQNFSKYTSDFQINTQQYQPVLSKPANENLNSQDVPFKNKRVSESLFSDSDYIKELKISLQRFKIESQQSVSNQRNLPFNSQQKSFIGDNISKLHDNSQKTSSDSKNIQINKFKMLIDKRNKDIEELRNKIFSISPQRQSQEHNLETQQTKQDSQGQQSNIEIHSSFADKQFKIRTYITQGNISQRIIIPNLAYMQQKNLSQLQIEQLRSGTIRNESEQNRIETYNNSLINSAHRIQSITQIKTMQGAQTVFQNVTKSKLHDTSQSSQSQKKFTSSNSKEAFNNQNPKDQKETHRLIQNINVNSKNSLDKNNEDQSDKDN